MTAKMERADEEKEQPTAKYFKAEEHIVSTYPLASGLADKLFEPYGKKDESGSRTAKEAKVRIRKRPESGFRVVLYKRIEDKQEKKNKEKKNKGKGKKQRHRTKGKVNGNEKGRQNRQAASSGRKS